MEINVKEIQNLDPETIAARYPREAIEQAIRDAGDARMKRVDEVKLAKILLGIVRSEKPETPLMEIPVDELKHLSPSTIASRYSKEDIRAACEKLGGDPFFDNTEIELAELLVHLANNQQ